VTDEQERALRDYRAASTNINKAVGGKAADGYEKMYSQAYQQCVRLGVFPQIRKKYR
jgi:hypothetical protein